MYIVVNKYAALILIILFLCGSGIPEDQCQVLQLREMARGDGHYLGQKPGESQVSLKSVRFIFRN